MFNLQGSEIIFILLLALVVLGPEKLPSAIRRFTQTYAELRKMGSGFQTELKSALDEPMREMKETAGLIRDQADPSKIIADAQGDAKLQQERDAERKLRAQEIIEQRKTRQSATSDLSSMVGATAAATPVSDSDDDADEWADPVDLDADTADAAGHDVEPADDPVGEPAPVRPLEVVADLDDGGEADAPDDHSVDDEEATA